MSANPCVSCGACCAAYRVSFYWAEADGLDDELVEKLTPATACMAGTNHVAPRCRALLGRVGERVECLVYERRPGPCRDLQPGDDQCQRARARHGLPMLGLEISTTGGGTHGAA